MAPTAGAAPARVSSHRIGLPVPSSISHTIHIPCHPAYGAVRAERQDAVVSARARIVDGAVGIVTDALDQLRRNDGPDLDTDSQSRLVSNLLVVLCSDRAVQPVMDLTTQRKAVEA